MTDYSEINYNSKMTMHQLSGLLDIELLSKLLSDITRITRIPTGIIELNDTIPDTQELTINVRCPRDKFDSFCSVNIREIVKILSQQPVAYINQCHAGSKILTIPIIVENQIIAILYQCPFNNEIIEESTTNNGKDEQINNINNLKFLKHFAELITRMANSKLKEIEINLELDHMLQKETIELLKTNKNLQKEITERRLTQKKLEKSEENLRLVFEHSPIGIVILTSCFKIIQSNRAVHKILGFNNAELQNIEFGELLPASDKRLLYRALKNLLKNQNYTISVEHRLIKKDKSLIYGRLTGSLIAESNEIKENLIVLMIEDVTDKILAEKELKESEERFRNLFENAPEALFIFDPKTKKILLGNKYNVDLFGYSTETLTNMTLPELEITNEKALQKKIQLILKENHVVVEEKQYKKSNNERIDVEVIATKNMYQGKECILCFIRDITQKKQYETQIINALNQEKELNKLRTNLVTTVSHEFKTPIAVIYSSVQLLEQYSTRWNQSKIDSLYDKIFKAISHTNRLIDNVLWIGRDQSGKLIFNPSPTPLKNFIQQIIDEALLMNGLEKSSIAVNLKIPKQDYNIDNNLMQLAISNLLNNAVKYSKETKEIKMEVLVQKAILTIVIKDAGIGIPTEDLKNVFEPFYRAPNAAHIKGTGIGMSIVKRCVDLHRGKIDIQSIENKGTTVVMHIPLNS